jgi:hypothetical protein
VRAATEVLLAGTAASGAAEACERVGRRLRRAGLGELEAARELAAHADRLAAELRALVGSLEELGASALVTEESCEG